MEDPDKTLVEEISQEDIQRLLRKLRNDTTTNPRKRSLPIPSSHLALKLTATEAAEAARPPSSCPQFSDSSTSSKVVHPSSHGPTILPQKFQAPDLLAPIELSLPCNKGPQGHETAGAEELLGSRANCRRKSHEPPSSPDPSTLCSKTPASNPQREESTATAPMLSGLILGNGIPSPSAPPASDLPLSSPALTAANPNSSQPTSSQPTNLKRPVEQEASKYHTASPRVEEPPAKKRRANLNPYSDLSLAHSSVRTPFKPPTMKKKETSTPGTGSSKTTAKPLQKDFAISALTSAMGPPQTPSLPPKHKAKSGVAAPFKSPLIRSAGGPTPASPSPSTSTSSRQTIVALEQRLQLLRHAQKIRSEGSIQKLEELTLKWTRVARSAAEDLWQLVRESGTVEGSQEDDDWGYGGEKAKTKDSNLNWGWDEPKKEDDEEELYPMDEEDTNNKLEEDAADDKQKEWNLGTMLESMGIPPESLGWDVEEGEFIEAS
ncbi:hypothetical protein FRB90_005104 [Tulasnella sp. 427]|nr:hypothetical protein FRB90_005104 [Tulasnella sp. 427]